MPADVTTIGRPNRDQLARAILIFQSYLAEHRDLAERQIGALAFLRALFGPRADVIADFDSISITHGLRYPDPRSGQAECCVASRLLREIDLPHLRFLPLRPGQQTIALAICWLCRVDDGLLPRDLLHPSFQQRDLLNAALPPGGLSTLAEIGRLASGFNDARMPGEEDEAERTLSAALDLGREWQPLIHRAPLFEVAAP